MHIRVLAACVLLGLAPLFGAAAEIRVATFQVDVTPPLGSPLCGGSVAPAEVIDDPLSARGIVLLVSGQEPIVLCAVDWLGIGSGSNESWRALLAEAAGTTPERVTVNTLHQHDAPFCDFTVEELLAEQDLDGESFDEAFAVEARERTAAAVREAVQAPVAVDHYGVGRAKVDQVASNRRILGPDGKVEHVRWTATRDEAVRARGVGVIDPEVKLLSFYQGTRPVAILTFYATHPQSHYGQGRVSADFPGMARAMRAAAVPRAAHIHFNGAGGNIGAGKYNDGSPENRPVLAQRLATGMRLAWERTERKPLRAEDIAWATNAVSMPPRAEIDLDAERALLADEDAPFGQRRRAAREITWHERTHAGDETLLMRLRVGNAQVLFMPGELFVEYQLAAQEMAPDSVVMMAAYGDYGPGYIGTAKAYEEGGYETQLYTSRTAPEVEEVLMTGMAELLE